MMADFSLEMMKDRRQWNSTFKKLKKKIPTHNSICSESKKDKIK